MFVNMLSQIALKNYTLPVNLISALGCICSCFNRYLTEMVPCYNNGLGSSQCSNEDKETLGRKLQGLYDGGETEVRIKPYLENNLKL